MKTYFISDLHLHESRPNIAQEFLAFLAEIKAEAEALYILGDLFEYWIGDDVLDTPLGEPLQQIVEQLRALSDNGTNIYFCHGNRDFLVGDDFMQRINAELLDETTVIDLYGTPTLLMHGDTLCTDDIEYMKMRAVLRNPQTQQVFLAMTIPERIEETKSIRMASQDSMQSKQEEILDVNQQAVEQAMREAGVKQLIHGHTHRPATHEFELDGEKAKRIVLGDWYEQCSYLAFSAT